MALMDDTVFRHVAVLWAEVVDYMRLIDANESDTRIRLKALQTKAINPKVRQHGGLIIRPVAGADDGFIVVFDNSGSAIKAATKIQETVTNTELEFPPEKRIAYRIGVLLGKVGFGRDGVNNIYGDAVSLAARLAMIAPSGGIVLSEHDWPKDRNDGWREICNDVGLKFDDISEQSLPKTNKPLFPWILVVRRD